MNRYLLLAVCAVGLVGCFDAPAGTGAAAPAMAPVTAGAAKAQACVAPDPLLLRTTWQAFRQATLAGQPQAVAGFIRFPLRLMGPMDDDKPLVISRPVFIKNYRELFQVGPAGDAVGLLTEMKKLNGAENVPAPVFDTALCRYPAAMRVRDYNFSYDKKDGWKIVSVFYGADYAVAKEAELNK